MEEKEFYVYVYLDPRKPGKYVYEKYEFEYEPFYVGKGFGCRYKRHLTEFILRTDKNKIKVNKIKKIKSLELEPIIKIVEKSLDENKILELEKYMIKIIGRQDLNLGVLVNLTDGGEGSSGHIMSEETKEKMRNRIITQETRDKISKANIGKTSSLKGLTKENCEAIRIQAEIQSQKFQNGILEKKFGKDNPNYGNKWTEEQKINASNKCKGQWLGDKNPNRIDASKITGKNNCNSKYKYLIYDYEDVIYDGYSLKEASQKLNINYNMLRKASNGYKYKKRYSIIKQPWRIYEITD